MRLKIIFSIFLFCWALTWARPGDDEKKAKIMEKMKLNLEKKPYFVKGKKSKPTKPSKLAKESKPISLEEYFKEQEKASVVNDNEKEKICMAVRDEMFPNFLTKLGLITKMIDDVTQFRIRLKRSRSRLNDEKPTKSRKTNDEEDPVGVSVEATEAIWKMKKKSKIVRDEDTDLTGYKKPPMLYHKSKTNKLGNKRGVYISKRNHDKDKLPSCYGYQYFYAVDAIDKSGNPDIEVFQEYFSDLSDDKLALQLLDIVNDCSNHILSQNVTQKCPDLRKSRMNPEGELGFLESCPEACLVNSDCAQNEVCCTNSCGGHFCYKSKNGTKKSRSLCSDADSLLKCVYDKIKLRICPKYRSSASSSWETEKSLLFGRNN